MKKIAVIDLMFRWPPDGGARIDLKEVLSRLIGRYDVTLFVPRVNCIIERGEIGEKMPFNVEQIPFDVKEFTGPRLAARLKTLLRCYNPDFVLLADGFSLKPWAALAVQDYPYAVKFYAYENFCLRYNGTFMKGDRTCYRTGMRPFLPDRLYCSLCGIKAVCNDFVNGTLGFRLEFLNARAYLPGHWKRMKKMLHNASALIVYNRLLQQIIRYCGWDSIVIPGGIDTSRFPHQSPRQSDGIVKLGVVGRIKDSYKGITFAIRAMNQLQCLGFNAELHLTGTMEDHHICFPGVVYRGWFSRETIHNFYRSIDICLVPSIWQEPFGIVTLEAMCSGRPIIASNVAGQREIITHNENGLLVAPQSSDAIVDAVVKYLQHPEFTERIVHQASATVRKLYDWDTIVSQHYIPVIEEAITGTSKGTLFTDSQ